MRGVVLDAALGEPGPRALQEEVVRERLAPQRAVWLVRLGEAAVQVEHADEAGPLAAPVGDGQDRALVVDQAGQHVVRVLPDCLGHDDRRRRGILAKTSRPIFWLSMKPCFWSGCRRAPAPPGALALDGRRRAASPSRPAPAARLVGGEPQVAARDEIDGLHVVLLVVAFPLAPADRPAPAFRRKMRCGRANVHALGEASARRAVRRAARGRTRRPSRGQRPAGDGLRAARQLSTP